MPSEAVGIALTDDSVEELRETRLPALFDAHHDRLYRLARRLVPTADDAKDLVQETFLRVVRTPASIPSGHASEEAWLVRILVNLCRDRWRQRALRSRLDAHYGAGSETTRSSAERALIARTEIWRALDALPPRRRAAIVLYELEGVGIPQIARLLSVSAVTVRWHLSRGRRELASIITGEKRGTS
jgi:RNA polymerase sigma-70 factor (ECF subfamily)